MGEVWVDRRPHRMTPAVVVADSWTRYRRNTPLLSLPRARMTPSLTTTPNRYQSVHTARHTAGYLSSSWEPRSTVTNISPSSTADVKKPRKETSKTTTDSSIFEDATTDVIELDDYNTTANNISTTSSFSKKLVPLSSHSTTPNNLNSSGDVATLTSQYGATSGSGDSKVLGADVREQAAEAEQSSVRADSDSISQVMTTSASSGEMMMTYLSDGAGNSSAVTQVQQEGATALTDAKQVTSDPGEATGDEVKMLSGSSRESVKDLRTTAALNDVKQVSTGETSGSMNKHPMLDVTVNNGWRNATVQSATDVDGESTADQSVDSLVTNTRGDATASTLAEKTSSKPDSTEEHVLNETGQGRSGRGGSMTSAKRELTSVSVRASSLTEGSTPTISSTNDTFPLGPRPVLVKSANSTENDSTVYWSNQRTLSCVIIKPF